jgi:hypothetical protein
MGATTIRGRILRAALCEIERGVFYATYPESPPDADQLIVYQVGTSAADARARIELSAHALGYETVIWKQTIKAPLFASPVKSAIRASVETYAAHFRA